MFAGLLGPEGDPFPEDSSLPQNVTVDTPDASPRDIMTGEPVLDNAPGSYVNGDGIYFDGSGMPINRDTGEPLPAGTMVDGEGYLVTPSDGVAASTFSAVLSFFFCCFVGYVFVVISEVARKKET